MYGPFGIAGFISTNDIFLEPLIYGGTGIESANPYMPEQLPIKYEAGSQNIMAIAGLNKAIKWIKKIGIQSIRQKEQENKYELQNILEKYDFLHTINPKGETIGIISSTLKGYSSDSLSNFFSENKVAIRTGLHCSPKAHEFLGTFPSGTIRFSTSYFNKSEDFLVLSRTLDLITD